MTNIEIAPLTTKKAQKSIKLIKKSLLNEISSMKKNPNFSIETSEASIFQPTKNKTSVSLNMT